MWGDVLWCNATPRLRDSTRSLRNLWRREARGERRWSKLALGPRLETRDQQTRRGGNLPSKGKGKDAQLIKVQLYIYNDGGVMWYTWSIYFKYFRKSDIVKTTNLTLYRVRWVGGPQDLKTWKASSKPHWQAFILFASRLPFYNTYGYGTVQY